MMDRTSAISRFRGPVPGLRPSTGDIDAKALGFRTGDVFHGQILRALPDGRVIVAAGSRQFAARTTLVVREGGRHAFQVTALVPHVSLKVLGETACDPPVDRWTRGRVARARLGRLLKSLVSANRADGYSSPTRGVLQGLRRLLPLIVYERPTGEDAVWLQKNLIASGLFWEHKLHRHFLGQRGDTPSIIEGNDLKELLILLKRSLEGELSQNTAVRPLLAEVTEAIGLIEADQILNLSGSTEGWGWFWFIPCAEESGLEQVEVYGKDLGAEEGYHVQVHVDLTRLGHLDVDLIIRDRMIDIRMISANPGARNILEQHLHRLKASLIRRGFRVNRLTCEDMAPESDFPVGGVDMTI